MEEEKKNKEDHMVKGGKHFGGPGFQPGLGSLPACAQRGGVESPDKNFGGLLYTILHPPDSDFPGSPSSVSGQKNNLRVTRLSAISLESETSEARDSTRCVK